MKLQEQAEIFCEHIRSLTGIPSILEDANTIPISQPCSGCGAHLCTECRATHREANSRFVCPSGFAFVVTPLYTQDGICKLRLCTGPFLITENPSGTSDVPQLSAQQAHALQETIRAICGYLTAAPVMQPEDIGIHHETLQMMHAMTQGPDYVSYPVARERHLQQLIRSGDKKHAQRLLNQLLLEIYSVSGSSINALKARVRDLMTLMSRAAVDGGANIEKVLSLCDQGAEQIACIYDFDTLDLYLSKLMHEFSESVFCFDGVKHKTIIRQISEYIQAHLTERLTLEETASHVYLSKSYLCRIIKNELGCTFTEYVNQLRIERSKLLLLYQNRSIAQVAMEVGFEDQSYFTRIFKRYVGTSPGRYRADSLSA